MDDFFMYFYVFKQTLSAYATLSEILSMRNSVYSFKVMT